MESIRIQKSCSLNHEGKEHPIRKHADMLENKPRLTKDLELKVAIIKIIRKAPRVYFIFTNTSKINFQTSQTSMEGSKLESREMGLILSFSVLIL